MKIFKDNSDIEQKLQKVEALMRELGISIDFDGYNMNITTEKQKGYVRDVESQTRTAELPRFSESEKIVVSDNL